MKIKTKSLWIIAVLYAVIWGKNIFAQNQLDKYIEEGITNNIVLNQKKISLEKAMYSLKTATSLFFPSINLEGDYTSGEGGRNISFPVGDLLNPVYSTLNQLIQSNNFPQLDNVKINFFPFHYYDVKLRTTMPIVNTDLIYNHSIQADQVHLKEYEVDAYKKELIKEIKTAYYNYLSALSAEKIYRNALKVAEEGKRVNESLLKNGKGLPVYILRSESEMADIDSKIVETQNSAQTAKRYFNFILNKDMDSEIDTLYNIQLKISKIDSMLTSNYDFSEREELKMLETGKNMNESVLKMKELYWVPKVNAFLDLGAQDQIWNLNKDSKYYLFGFQLSVPIFEAFRNSYKADEAELNVKDAQLSLDFTAKQIKLSQSIAKNDLISARQNYYTAEKKYKAASSYERLIEKGYKEGVNTFIETIDARSQLTQAALMVNINTNKVLSALTNYERETGSMTNY
jgi:outer membrane protein